ncbi:MAG TPA: GNAT family N-acetyltransferase [Firmicutes bacterium]|nr:GNAT family N-acetyltransferase [Bacillota bacterium]HHY99354.1 GNAT family N-acetyltransferase [Bacillota bacterium]
MLQGEKIVLREFRRDDIEPIQRWVNNENIIKYLAFPLFPQTLEETTEFVERQLHKKGAPNEGIFVIALKDDPKSEYIGSIGLHRIDYRNRHCELGIVIGREDLLGKGIGREAIQMVLGFAFNFLNMHKVNLRVYEYNERARHCYAACGFKEEGRIRDQRYYNGKYWDEIIMGIIKEEYLAQGRKTSSSHE